VGFEVEEIIKQGSDLTGPLVFAKVLSIEELTEFKKPVRYVGLDCGEKETRYVICGATNFAVGDLIVAALPGAVLPGDFSIGARETYGKTSNGMICSARELGLGDDHSGIMTFATGTVEIGSDAIAGLMAQMIEGDRPIGFDERRHFGRAKQLRDHLRLLPKKTYQGLELTGDVMTLYNGGRRSVEIHADWFLEKGVRAVSLSSQTLLPHQSALVYRVSEKAHG